MEYSESKCPCIWNSLMSENTALRQYLLKEKKSTITPSNDYLGIRDLVDEAILPIKKMASEFSKSSKGI